MIELLLIELIDRQTLQESCSRQHISMGLDFYIASGEDFLEHAMRRMQRECPVPGL